MIRYVFFPLSLRRLLFESMTRNLGHRRLLLDFVIVFVRFLKVSIWLAVCGFVFSVDCFTSLFLQSTSCVSVFAVFLVHCEFALSSQREANSRFSTLDECDGGDVVVVVVLHYELCETIDLNYALAIFFLAKMGYTNMWNICTISHLARTCVKNRLNHSGKHLLSQNNAKWFTNNFFFSVVSDFFFFLFLFSLYAVVNNKNDLSLNTSRNIVSNFPTVEVPKQLCIRIMIVCQCHSLYVVQRQLQ